MACFKWRFSAFLMASLLTASLLAQEEPAQEAAQETTSSPDTDKDKLDQKFDSKVSNVVDTICKNLDEKDSRETVVANILFGKRETNGEELNNANHDQEKNVEKRSWLKKTWRKVKPWLDTALKTYRVYQAATAVGKRMNKDDDPLDYVDMSSLKRELEQNTELYSPLATRDADNATEKVCSTEESQKLKTIKKAAEDLNKLVELSEAAGC
ncbi:hypothetical protein Bpfe_015131 [Biomphalaria pfeifferi]|uniref:Uncharacterized protein n=1 Tax=Biomphalaria pfeifferi TaxID=112525 RepID=A0AAD8F9J8_BIOPF|nr:hypothetical protein Bpfe_015131 [Biomphalaria pfeifferi]